jgi:hypothetical protein
MKINIYIAAAALGLAMMTWTGCEKDSSNPPATTNSVSADMPTTNGTTINAPPTVITNNVTPSDKQ